MTTIHSAGGPYRRTVLLGVLAIALTLPAVGATSRDRMTDLLAPRVEACAACHGSHGEGIADVYFPRLAGKPAGYLFNQLTAFRSARRHYPPMHYLLEFQPDSYLEAMAAYFASQRPPLPTPALATVSDTILARGETLVTQGDAIQGIPACSNCHGRGLTGMEPAIPGLLGLHASYISAQLGAWRYGTRTAIAPDCMQIVAGHLSEDDVKAVAAWLSSRPAAGDPSPVPAGSYALPLACGSEPN